MSDQRYLIVNADDFGLSLGVNHGIIEAYEHGIVTSASLMVRCPAAAAAAAYARAHPSLGLGLHLDLGEWAYHSGSWDSVYQVVSIAEPKAVAAEILQQLSTFRGLVGREPTHIDSHQHVHLRDSVRSVLQDVALRLAVPLRHYEPGIRTWGDFYGQTAEGEPRPDWISVDGLIAILRRLPPGITELSCHPGNANPLDTAYSSERAREVRTLCDPRVRAAIAGMGIQLCSFVNAPLPTCRAGGTSHGL